MRLLLVNNPIPVHNKAPEVLLEKLLRVLEGPGRQIDLIAANLSAPRPVSTPLCNLADWPYDNGKENFFLKMVRPLFMQLRYAFALFGAPRPDLAIFWIGGRRLLLPLLAARLRRIPTFVFALTAFSRVGLKETFGMRGACIEKCLLLLEKTTLPLATRLFVESPGCIAVENLQKHADRGRVLIQHLWIESSTAPHRIPSQDNALQISYVGRLIVGKAVVELVRAVRRLRAGGCPIELSVAGSGPLEGLVAAARGDDEGIRLLGWIDSDAVAALYSKIDLLVLPTEQEGLPNVVIEAMARNVPVLATPVGGIPDLIKDGETGFLLSDVGEDTIVAAIDGLRQRDDLQRVGEAGGALVRSRFSLENARRLFDENLRDILSANGGGGR